MMRKLAVITLLFVSFALEANEMDCVQVGDVCVVPYSPFAKIQGSCFEEDGCRRYTGVGLGVVRDDDKRPVALRQLVAIRAAKLDALRSLTEQIKGVQVASQSEVVSSELTSDKISSQSQGSLQGVRFVNVKPLDDKTYQAIVELDVRNEENKRGQ